MSTKKSRQTSGKSAPKVDLNSEVFTHFGGKIKSFQQRPDGDPGALLELIFASPETRLFRDEAGGYILEWVVAASMSPKKDGFGSFSVEWQRKHVSREYALEQIILEVIPKELRALLTIKKPA